MVSLSWNSWCLYVISPSSSNITYCHNFCHINCHNFCYNYLTSQTVIDYLSLLHRSTTFSPSFTVCHVDSCGSSCCAILFGLRIFLFHPFTEILHFFFFFWLREMRTSWHGLAFWYTSTWLWLGFVISVFFFFRDTHSPIKINRPLNHEVWCNLWEIIRSARQTP